MGRIIEKDILDDDWTAQSPSEEEVDCVDPDINTHTPSFEDAVTKAYEDIDEGKKVNMLYIFNNDTVFHFLSEGSFLKICKGDLL